MQYRMTVGANGPQVIDGIHDVLFADLSKRTEVMYVNVPIRRCPVYMSEIKSADATIRTVRCDARGSSLSISLVSVNLHPPNVPLTIRRFDGNLFGKTKFIRTFVRRNFSEQRVCYRDEFTRPRATVSDLDKSVE